MDKKLKLAFYIDSLGCGGAEKSLVTLLSYIHPYYDIVVYVVKRGGVLETELPIGVELMQLQIPKFSMLARFRKALYVKAKSLFYKNEVNPVESYWRYYGKYIKKLSSKFDVAIAYSQGFPTFFVAEKVDATRKLAWINADIIKQKYTYSFNIKFYRNFDRVVCVSENLKNIMLSQYSDLLNKFVVINDIVPANTITNKSKQKIEDVDNSLIKIVTVGRLVRIKGYDLAIGAAAILKDRNIRFKWYFIGDGPERETLSSKIADLGLEDNIILKGALNNPYPYVKAANIYVQPSYSEGFGISLCEAKILYRPIVATDFEVVHNLIENNVNGLISKKDAVAIAQSIERLINDESLRNRLSKNLEMELNAKNEDTELNRVIELINL